MPYETRDVMKSYYNYIKIANSILEAMKMA